MESKRFKIGRFGFLSLSVLFALCIFTQILLAGIALFVDARAWMQHIMFVHFFGFNIPIFMLVFAIIGAFPRRTYWQLFGIFISIFLMYFTVNMNAHASWLGPFHVIIAVLLFMLSCYTVLTSWKISFIMKGRK